MVFGASLPCVPRPIAWDAGFGAALIADTNISVCFMILSSWVGMNLEHVEEAALRLFLLGWWLGLVLRWFLHLRTYVNLTRSAR